MKSFKKNASYIVFALIAIIGLILFFSAGRNIKRSSKDSIAEVKEFENNVQQKQFGSIFWDKVAKQSEILEHSYIFSGESSSVVIELETGEVITLGPNTIIRLQLNQVELESGEISGDFLKTTLKIGDRKIQNTNSTNFKVKAVDNSIEVEGLEQDLKIRVDNDVVELSKSSFFDLVHERKIDDQSLALLAPQEGSVFASTLASRLVKFDWIGKAPENSKLSIDRKSSVGNFVNVEFDIGQNAMELMLPCGEYRWSINHQDINLEPLNFVIPCEEGSIVRLLEPFNRASIILSNQDSVDVNFRWQSLLDVNVFLIKNSNMKYLYHERASDKFSYSFTRADDYYVEIIPFLNWPIWQKALRFKYQILDESMLKPKIKSPKTDMSL